MADHDPYSPPDQWVDIFRRIPELTAPRLIVSISAGRGAYRPVESCDLRPSVTRVVGEPGKPETLTFHAGDFLPGSAHDVAASMYADAAAEFLGRRKADGGAYLRAGRIRIQLFDADAEIASHSLGVERSAFGVVDDLVETGGTQSDAIVKVLENHSRTIGEQFIRLAKQSGEQAASERAGLIDYTRGALDLTREAGEFHASAAAELERAKHAGFFASEAGVMATAVLLEQLPKIVELGALALKIRKMKAEAAIALAPKPKPEPKPEPKPTEAAKKKAKAKPRAKRTTKRTAEQKRSYHAAFQARAEAESAAAIEEIEAEKKKKAKL